MVEARHLEVAGLLRDEQELAGLRVGAQQQTHLLQDGDVEALEAEHLTVEPLDLVPVLGEHALRDRDLHVVEAQYVAISCSADARTAASKLAEWNHDSAAGASQCRGIGISDRSNTRSSAQTSRSAASASSPASG